MEQFFPARQFRPFLRWGEPWTAYFLEYLVVAYITKYSCCQVSCVNSFTSSEGLKKNPTEMASKQNYADVVENIIISPQKWSKRTTSLLRHI